MSPGSILLTLNHHQKLHSHLVVPARGTSQSTHAPEGFPKDKIRPCRVPLPNPRSLFHQGMPWKSELEKWVAAHTSQGIEIHSIDEASRVAILSLNGEQASLTIPSSKDDYFVSAYQPLSLLLPV